MQELATLEMSAGRLEEYRLAWLSMRQLTTNLGALPAAALAVFLYLLVIITLCAYQTVVSLTNGYTLLFCCSFTLCIMFEVSLLALCDTAHRLTETVS